MGIPLPATPGPAAPVPTGPRLETLTGLQRAQQMGLVKKCLSSKRGEKRDAPRRRRKTPDPDPSGGDTLRGGTLAHAMGGTDG